MKSENSIEPVCQYAKQQVDKWIASANLDKPLFIFVTGQQGSGKSYTSARLQEYLNTQYTQLNTILVSIDDFYLTHKDQLELEQHFPKNKLLKGRGLPGTHDLELLQKVLSIITTNAKTNTIELPRYDKSKFNGLGDRLPKPDLVELPVHIVIFEGWFVGYNPITVTEGCFSTEDMNVVNDKLLAYGQLLWNNPLINSIGIILRPDNLHNVYSWREQQEHQLIERTGFGMTDADVKKFIDRYWPCYLAYFDNLVKSNDLGSLSTLSLTIDIHRRVIDTTVTNN